MKNCANCKNLITNSDNISTSRTCSVGNTDAMKNWLLLNGGKPKHATDNMPCFQDFEGNVILNEIISKLSEMNLVLQNHKKITKDGFS